MATNDQVKALVKSHADGDDSQFYSVAMQVAAKAARRGHAKSAQELRDLVTELRRETHAKAKLAPVLAISQPRGELASLVTVSYPDVRFNSLVLSEDIRKRLKNVIVEQRQRDKLARYNLQPVRRLLFTGPPGTGKTSSAKALAGELKLPLFSIRLEAILTKFMGETAAKLRIIFDALSENKGVYFFDEVDAIAGERTSQNDVGEIRRVLNSFLQFLEEDTSESVIVAATNHPQLLDGAFFRRFDQLIDFDLPRDEEIRDVIENRIALFDLTGVAWDSIRAIADGLSHSEIATAAENTAKRVILSEGATDDPKIWTQYLAQELEERSSFGKVSYGDARLNSFVEKDYAGSC